MTLSALLGIEMADDNTTAPEEYAGQLGLTDQSSFYNMLHFMIRQAIGMIRVQMPVKVVAVTGGGVDVAGTVDVQPLVQQIDGTGKTTSHGVVYGIPFSRNQGGTNVIINDPKVGDIGTIAIHDRDISALKNTSKESPPGSFRRFSPSDGVYHAAMLNLQKPKQYHQFTDTGMVQKDMSGSTATFDSGNITHTAGSGSITHAAPQKIIQTATKILLNC